MRNLLPLFLVAAFQPARAQFTVEGIEFRADGSLEVRFPADAGSYYRLLGGAEPSAIIAPVALGLTPPLLAPPGEGPMRFYRVQQVPRTLSIDSDGDQIPDFYELQHEFLNGLNSLDAAADPDGNGRTALQEYTDSLDDGKLVTISSTFPTAGEAGVSVNRETVLHFSAPIAANAEITSANFFAGFAGRKFLSRVELSSDRRKATLFYLEPIPGSTRISAVFDATGIKDRNGRDLDADGDGQPGGLHLLQFDTYSTTPIVNTAISGRVFASEPVPDGAGGVANRPLPGVTVTVDGAEETMRAVTDAEGRFTLQNCPAGRFFVHIDGRTSPLSSWPGGAYYPNVGKAWTALGGRADNLVPGDGIIYLPLIAAETLKPVSVTQDTEIRLAPSAIEANPALAGVKILVPANSLFDNDGKRGGMVGITIVDPARLPEPLPGGLVPTLVITVQSDGGQNFDRPVPACFPNLPNSDGFPLLPGARGALISFNHDTGKWETIGSATVSGDGKLVCTDPGVGIRQPGWHLITCPQPNNSPPKPPSPPFPPTSPNPTDPDRDNCHTVTDPGKKRNCDLTNDAEQAECQRARDAAHNACVEAGNSSGNCSGAFLDQQRDECVANAKSKRNKCVDGAVTTVCSSGAPSPLRPTEDAGPGRDETPAQRALALLDQITALRLGLAGAAPTGQELAALQALQAELNGITGPDSVAFWRAVAAAAGAEAARFDLYSWGAPPHAIYRAGFHLRSRLLVEFGSLKLAWQNFFQRELTEPFGQYQVFLPVSALRGMDGREATDSIRIDNWFYDARTRSVGRSSVNGISAAGLSAILPSFTLVPLRSRLGETAPLLPTIVNSTLGSINTEGQFHNAEAMADQINAAITALDGRDTDNDGLADLAEFIIGTDPRNPDSDGDGIADGAEIDQGTNPLDGRPAAVGVVGSVPVQGEAVDVAAFNDRAVMALRGGGIGVFDVAAERLGVLVARLDAPGEVRVVALSQEFAVAGGDYEGLLVLDPRNPGSGLRRILVAGKVSAAAVEGGFAWIGTSVAELHLMDLSTGRVLDSAYLSAPAFDIALDQGVATVVLNQDLLTFEQVGGMIFPLGQAPHGLFLVDPVTGRRRLSVGNQTAYANSYAGFGRYDLSNPLSPSLISPWREVAGSFKQILPTGSGFGLAVVGANPNDKNPATHNVQLIDLRDPLVNNNAGAIIRTPGLARAASIYNGLAYVADSAAGLQIVNFLASDTGGIPPTISLRTSADGGRAEEGHLLRLSAAVTDDVMVRAVEFYRNGERLASDGNFPFEVAFLAPTATAAKSNVVVRARAIDTGGHATWSEELTLELTPDATAPRLVRTLPASGALQPSITSVLALFSESLDPKTVTQTAIQLRGAGPDGVFGNADDLLIQDVSFDLRAEVPSVAVNLRTILAPGAYRLTFSQLLKDLAGNPLAAEVNVQVSIYDVTLDTDGDGLPDGVELLLGLDPLKLDSNNDGIPDGNVDSDADGLRNSFEIAYGLNPLLRDTDRNGILDGDEDRDQDGLREKREQAAGTNPLQADSDADGWSDESELTAGSNPLSPASKPFLAIVALPPIEVIAPRVTFGPIGLFGTTVAQPPVEIIAPRVAFDRGVSFGTTVARPPVEILAPRVTFGVDGSFGTTVAQPPVEILAPQVVFGGDVSFGTTVARPPVEILAPRVIFGPNGFFGTTVANPPVTVEFSQ